MYQRIDPRYYQNDSREVTTVPSKNRVLHPSNNAQPVQQFPINSYEPFRQQNRVCSKCQHIQSQNRIDDDTKFIILCFFLFFIALKK